MFRPFRIALVLMLSLAPALPALAQDKVISTSPEDPAMTAAIQTAQSHLTKVLVAAINEVGVGHPALSLKVAFPVYTGETDAEVIWLSDISLAQDGMAGKLANEPVNLPGLHLGDEVRFRQDMIYDWGLVGPEGKVFGHYTTRALLENLPEAQAGPIRARLSDDPLPEAWR